MLIQINARRIVSSESKCSLRRIDEVRQTEESSITLTNHFRSFSRQKRVEKD